MSDTDSSNATAAAAFPGPAPRETSGATSTGAPSDLAGVGAEPSPNAVAEHFPSALSAQNGRELWRSLEELAGTDSFEAFLRREYPSQLHKLDDAPERREFLKLMGASIALAGISSCTRQPREKILPYAKSPESLVPGQPLYFATAMPWASGAIGLLVESHMGRPTKVEGNPEHPSSRGATDVFAQAAILELYDPDRARVVSHRGRVSTWDAFLTVLAGSLATSGAREGGGLAILSEPITSPTLAAQREALLAAQPRARWYEYAPVVSANARRGAELAFGTDLAARPRFDVADVIVSLEGDFLGAGPDGVRATRDFTARRKVRAGDAQPLNRLYVVESALTNTGAAADHRLAIRSSDVEAFARALARRLGLDVASSEVAVDERWIAAVAKDLEEHRGSSVVVTCDAQTPAVHALVHAINARLGNVGATVDYFAPAAATAIDEVEALVELVASIDAGLVETLVILGGNPVYTAPADVDFTAALTRVKTRVHLGLHEDETSARCDWHVNEAHWLESWSDCRAADGTASIVQPLIAPLYGGKSAHEVVAAIAGAASSQSYDLVREHWRNARGVAAPDPAGLFEKAWRRALHDGSWAESAARPATPALRAFAGELAAPAAARGIEVVFRPDPSVWDGRFANNGWLQELPKPMTKLVWDNAAHLSPATADRIGVATGDVIEIELAGRTLRTPVWISPGHADESILLTLGYGRAQAGTVGTGVGYDASRLRTSQAMHVASGAIVRKTGIEHRLVSTQGHDSMEGRDIVRVATIDRFRENPHLFDRHGAAEGHETSLFPDESVVVREGHAWGMVIDLNACTACNACVVACQSENNIPVVGKKEVERGREMHWLRIDRYYEGARNAPKVLFQPMLCQHCETAPCEYVCPVAATTHSNEGLNEMTYNRCIGTRYCANNCPYKVRRFNFFLYADYATESLALSRNPDVTVRSRGVMEKCTYCVQRINQARIQAKKEDRKIRDGEVVTACQQVCPADAIVFGDVNDPSSRVSRQKGEPQNYGVLAELNTKPRTTYLARLRNPNPELEA